MGYLVGLRHVLSRARAFLLFLRSTHFSCCQRSYKWLPTYVAADVNWLWTPLSCYSTMERLVTTPRHHAVELADGGFLWDTAERRALKKSYHLMFLLHENVLADGVFH